MSYSRKDEAVMRRIAMYLREHHIKVWVDNEKLVPGTPIWEAEIEKALDLAFAVIVLLSPDSKGSEWVRREITFAEQYRKRIFPVLVRGTEDASISIRLITCQYVDIRHDEEKGLNSLVEALYSYLKEWEKGNRSSESELDKKKRISYDRAEAIRIAREREQLERRQTPKPVATPTEENKIQGQKVKLQPWIRGIIILGIIFVLTLLCAIIGRTVWPLIFPPTPPTSTQTSLPVTSPTSIPTKKPVASPTFIPMTMPVQSPTILVVASTITLSPTPPAILTTTAPVIEEIELPHTIICDGRRYNVPIYFHDSDGDAYQIEWELIYSKNNSPLYSTIREFVIESRTQRNGAVYNDWIEWNAPGDEVQIRVYISDRNGLTGWKDFKFKCSN